MKLLDLGSNWRPSRGFIQSKMKLPRYRRLKLETFPRGFDGSRIDVWLGDKLAHAIGELVESSLAERMDLLSSHKECQIKASDCSSTFCKLYGASSLYVAQRARMAKRREIYQLFHLAVLKKILLEVDRQLAQLFNSDPGVGGFDHRAERLWLYRRGHKRLRYLVAHDVLNLVRGLDRRSRKRRKSLLALSWPVAEELLFNPLLQIGHLDCEESFLECYPLALCRADRFRAMELVIKELVGPWLPESCRETPEPLDLDRLKALPLRADKGELAGYAEVEAFLRQVVSAREYRRGKQSWLDYPPNLVRLFDHGSEAHQRSPWHHPHWNRYQEELLHRLEYLLTKADLLQPLLASVCLRRIYPELGRRGTPGLLLDFLLGKRSQQEVISALEKLEEIPNLQAFENTLSRARGEMLNATAGVRHRWLMEALEGYGRLRRDLKLAWQAYRAMDNFRLLEDGEHLELSRANGLLQDFSLEGKDPDTVAGHVIIKADLRGSTELIAGMNKNGINPATYFSRNLFSPLNTLLETYGAEKVFLEGDAAILMILDYAGDPRLVVARACGLAVELISLVNKRNRENRLRGLPELELGVGVAYEAQPPTYLFDEEPGEEPRKRKITISPAIHRADRLSSSNLSKDLLERLPRVEPKGWGVEVVVLEDSANPVAKQGELRRYNVNGVELDAAAFNHLKLEMALKTLPAEAVGGAPGDCYHLGRFTDDSDVTRWLVLREAKIRQWDGKQLSVPDGDQAPSFYEVVTIPELAKKIRDLCTGKA